MGIFNKEVGKKKREKNDDARNKDINYNSKFLDEID